MKMIFVFLLLISGCIPQTPLTNDEIIRESKKCSDAKMRTVIGYHGWTGMPTVVICVPEDK
jgi:hypothetical protein